MRTNDEMEKQHGPPMDIWVSLVILVRVAAILVFFLVLFLAIFMGYFTFPLLLIAAAAGIYVLIDFWVNFFHRKRAPDRREREEFLRAYQEEREDED
jgi:hypothetical protein